MPNNNGIITAPVSIGDVAGALGVQLNDLGKLCQSSNINKWALHKPVEYNSMCEITDEQIYEANAGIDVPYDENLTSTGAITLYQSGIEWTYKRPSSNFRLTDFIGYKMNAKPPFGCYFEPVKGKKVNGQVTVTPKLNVYAAKNNSDIDIYNLADFEKCGWVVLHGETIYGMNDSGKMEYLLDGEGLSMSIESIIGGEYALVIMKPNGKMYLLDNTFGVPYINWTPEYSTSEDYYVIGSIDAYSERGTKNSVYFRVKFRRSDNTSGVVNLSKVVLVAYDTKGSIAWSATYTDNKTVSIPEGGYGIWLTSQEDTKTNESGITYNYIRDDGGSEIDYYELTVTYESETIITKF